MSRRNYGLLASLRRLASARPLSRPAVRSVAVLTLLCGSSPLRASDVPPPPVTAGQAVAQEAAIPLDDIPVSKPITAMTVRTAPSSGELPTDYAKTHLADRPAEFQPPGFSRPWPLTTFHWDASALYHDPLYFEDVNLERYGLMFDKAQPVVSGAKFFGRIPLLPYLMVVDHPHDCVYDLGYYRPGSCAPYQHQQLPSLTDARLFQHSNNAGSNAN